MKNWAVLGMCLLVCGCASLKTSSEYIARANGYLKDGKRQQAIASFNKAIELNPRNLDAYEGRGAAYFFDGKFAAARKDFEYVLDKNPQQISVYTAYASVLAAQGYFKDALTVLNAADALRPAHAETYFARGGVYFMLGQYDWAVADYTRVLQLKPSADAYNARGAAYLQWGKPELAQADFEAAKSEDIPQHINEYAALDE